MAPAPYTRILSLMAPPPLAKVPGLAVPFQESAAPGTLYSMKPSVRQVQADGRRRAPSGSLLRYVAAKKYLYLLLLPAVVYFIVFHYVPMYGVIIAFKDFSFSKGILKSAWVGLANFKYMLALGDFREVFWNSLSISFLRLVFGFPFPILFALMLNEMRAKLYTKATQTIIYFPYFISWVVIGGILVMFLSPSWGVLNDFIKYLGGKPIFFLAERRYFKPIVVLADIWKNAGWGSILYIAAITGINPELYDAAFIDGANRLQRIRFITLPSIASVIMIMLILRIGQIMNNGFEQIYIIQNPSNLSYSEVFETYTYRVGLVAGRFAFGTTVGLFTSTIGFILLLAANRAARVFGQESIW
jgi:putative aldouronate transport system permease protein